MQAVWVEKGVFTLTKREKPTPAAHEVLIEQVEALCSWLLLLTSL